MGQDVRRPAVDVERSAARRGRASPPGTGPSPSGRTMNPWTRWPFGFSNHHVSNARPAGARRAVGLERAASRADGEDRGAGCSPWWTRYQTSPSGRTAAAVIEPGSVSSGATEPVREVVAVEPVPPVDELEQEQRRAVRPPVDGLDRPHEVERSRSVDARPSRASHVAGRSLARPLVRDREPRVARDRREPEPGRAPGPRRAAPRRVAPVTASIDPQRRVEHVAVLHDLEHRERLVRSTAPAGRPRSSSPHPPASRTGSACSWTGVPRRRRSATQIENPSSVLTPATIASAPIARPSGQPSGRPSSSGSGAGSARRTARSRRRRSRRRSRRGTRPRRSRRAVGRPSSTPTGSSVTWRRTPVRRSQAWSW